MHVLIYGNTARQTYDAMLRVSIIHVTVVDCNEIKKYYIVILKYTLEKISKTKGEIEDEI